MIVDVLDPNAGSAAAAGPALLKVAASVERAISHIFDRFVGARQKHVENRDCPFQFLRLQIHLHVFGDEETKTKRGMHCFLEVMESGSEISGAQRIRWRTERFFPA